jgi:hypothetical protein
MASRSYFPWSDMARAFHILQGKLSTVGGSVTGIMLRSSRLRHQRERLPHGFSYKAATLAFTDGDVVRRDFATMAISKPTDNSRSFR